MFVLSENNKVLKLQMTIPNGYKCQLRQVLNGPLTVLPLSLPFTFSFFSFICKLCLVQLKLNYIMTNAMGAWIAKWYSHSTFEHWNATPWAMRSILGDDYSFSAQA